MGVDNDSVFARRIRLYKHIQNGELSTKVLDELLPGGEPHESERHLWDYKLELPLAPVKAHPTEQGQADFDAKLSDIIKDAVSFYNSYGGYLVVGVRDKPRQIEGFNGAFDCDDLNRRLQAYTKHKIECHFRSLPYKSNGIEYRLGLLYIPQRPDDCDTAQFCKDAKPDRQGRTAFKRNDIDLRDADECRPATSPADFSFLCAPGRRRFAQALQPEPTPVLDNNLGPRDPGFIRFIGRDEYLTALWRWLWDRYSPVKLLAGLGGVGKTTLARQFAEGIAGSSPMGLEKVTWLSAKPQYYSAIAGKYVPTLRVDFVDALTLLKGLLLELGTPEEQIDSTWMKEDFMEQIIASLRVIPSLIVVDDLDSLAPDQQHEVFHTLIQILSQTIGTCSHPSRAILTARLDLGASPAQLIRVEGLHFNDFLSFIDMTAREIGLHMTFDPKAKLVTRFHKVTQGSPIFAASVLKLLRLGDTLDAALTQWQGSDGEDVRTFAFKKELDRLGDSQIRTLYALCLLGETSLVELRSVLESNESLTKDDLNGLREYHLLSCSEGGLAGGARLIIPDSIRLMRDLLRSRIADPKRLEVACVRSREGYRPGRRDVSNIIHRVVALWSTGQPNEALELAQVADKEFRDNADIKCLLGRAYMRVADPNYRQADMAFKRAYELGSTRSELFPLWFEARISLQDWTGVLDISQCAKDRMPLSDIVRNRAFAYGQLAEVAKNSGDLRKAADHYKTAAIEINDAFVRGHAIGNVPELRDMRTIFSENYVRMVDMQARGDDEYIVIWLAVADAFWWYVRKASLLRLGLKRLSTWWQAVEARERLDGKAANLMSAQLKRISKMLEVLEAQQHTDGDLIAHLAERRNALYERLGAYRNLIENDLK